MPLRFVVVACSMLLCACVPKVGDYSDFVLHQTYAASGTAQATSFIPMVGGRYQGPLRGGYPHGEGVFEYSDGRRFVGQFDNGRLQGKGTMTYPGGRRVEGVYQRDSEQQVVLYYPDGWKFEGAVAKGVPAGQGVMTRPGGDTLTGRFDATGGLQGKGLHAAADGSPLYAGPFVDGKRHGQGVCPTGICEFSKGKDVTEASLVRQAETIVERRIDEEFGREKTHREQQQARAEKEVSDAVERQRVLKGPQGANDGCYCALEGCVEIFIGSRFESAKEMTPRRNGETWESHLERIKAAEKQLEEQGKLRERQRRAECRVKYAEWLGRPAPTAAELAAIDRELAVLNGRLEKAKEDGRRDAEAIEQRRKQAQADREEKQRLAQIERDRIETERRAELEKKRQECDNSTTNWCHCGAVYAALKMPRPARWAGAKACAL